MLVLLPAAAGRKGTNRLKLRGRDGKSVELEANSQVPCQMHSNARSWIQLEHMQCFSDVLFHNVRD